MKGKKAVRINSLKVTGKYLYIRLKEEDIKGRRDSIKVTVRNIRDIDGNVVGKRKSIALYQYRELFVQEYNKPLPLKTAVICSICRLKKTAFRNTAAMKNTG